MDRTYVIDLDEIPGLWRSGADLRRAKYARKGITRERDDSLTYSFFLYDAKGRLYAVTRRHNRQHRALAADSEEARDLIRTFGAPERLDVWDMALYPTSQVEGDRIKTWTHGHFVYRPRPDSVPSLSPAGRLLLRGTVFA